jgi:SulP family sulfate permease
MKEKILNRNIINILFPFLIWGRRVNKGTVRDDFVAGITGAVIVLPQGVAYALIAGLPPEYGLYTAIVTPIIAGLFGSSMHLVSGPTAAISIVVLSVVGPLAEPGTSDFLVYALTLTFLTGVFQLLLGFLRAGALVNFISHTVVIGFTTGAAFIIASSQLKHYFGLDMPRGELFFPTMGSFFNQIGQSNPYVIAVASVTLLSGLLIKKLRPKWPAMLLAMVTAGIFSLLIDAEAQGVPMVGALLGQLPPLSMPDFSLVTSEHLTTGAVALGILALVEAVSIARAVATRSHQSIDGNQEFIGQGLSNIVGSFFSCYAGSGSFTRTGANYDSGAKTPLAAVFAALVLSVILVFFSGLTAYLPIPAMAGVILLISWNLLDFHHIKLIYKASKQEALILAVTFLATLTLHLQYAIYVGVFLSLILYLKRTSKPAIVHLAPDSSTPRRSLRNVQRIKLPECPQLRILRLDGSLFFGAVDSVQRTLQDLSGPDSSRHILLIGRGVNFIDVAGAEMLIQEAGRLKSIGGGLYLSGFKRGALKTFEKGGYLDQFGPENLFESAGDAISVIKGKMSREVCMKCRIKLFEECQLDLALKNTEEQE